MPLLLPHPGAFEQIRRRARRRKATRAALTAAGAVVVLAGVITVPRLILNGPAGSTPVAQGGTPTPAQPSTGPGKLQSTGTPGKATSSATPTPTPTAPPAVPANFAASSVTFVSTSTGWVIGQAGTPGHCGPPKAYDCTSVAATNDGGSTWHGVPAPVTGAPDGATGAGQIRSLDGVSAWAFGPQLYATHDGGRSWTRIRTHGMRVTDLETVNGLAFAVWARCTGTGADFAANCTSFSLYFSAAGSDSWAPVPGMTGLTDSPSGQPGQPSSAQLVLTGARGYLLAPDGAVYSGPVTAGAAWQPPVASGSPLPGCGKPGPAQADGLPSDTMLAATGTGLEELCQAQSRSGMFLMYSADGGHSWTTDGVVPPTGPATSLSGTPTGQVLVATTSGIDVSRAVAGTGGASSLHWRTVQGASVPGGFSYVGMTTAQQGVAVPADTSLHAVWFTYDGGAHWTESPVR